MRQIGKLLLAALAVGLAGCGSAGDVLPDPPAAPIHDHLIVPGVRVGPVSLGMTAPDLYRTMGEPLKTEAMFDGNVTEFSYPGFAARVSNRLQRVNYIYVTSPEYATQSGVKVGFSDLAVRASQGNPTTYHSVNAQNSSMCYADGMALILRNGIVEGLAVWTPGCP